MGRNDREARGEAYHGKLARSIRDDATVAARAGDRSSAATQEADRNRRIACSTLSHLFMRDDGWLRAVPSGDGKTIYIKWKFTRGPWSGHYVMAVAEIWQWDYALALLIDKLEAVDVGVKRPSRDTPYDA